MNRWTLMGSGLLSVTLVAGTACANQDEYLNKPDQPYQNQPNQAQPYQPPEYQPPQYQSPQYQAPPPTSQRPSQPMPQAERPSQPSQPETVPPPALPPQAERTPQAGASNVADVAQMTRMAQAHINEAIAAIERGDTARADQLLAESARMLRQLYAGTPGVHLVRQIDRADARLRTGTDQEQPRGAELGPLAAQVKQAAYLDPRVGARIKDAQSRSSEGDNDGARASLHLAREALVSDVALLPIEEAYVRVEAARTDLREGHREIAERLLRSTPMVLEEVQMEKPLVPVRFDLRSAAVAAEQGNWPRARELVDQAAGRLDTLDTTGDPRLVQEIRPLSEKVDQLRDRIDGGNKPRPRELRELAQHTHLTGTCG
jgi:hypothetical protein